MRLLCLLRKKQSKHCFVRTWWSLVSLLLEVFPLLYSPEPSVSQLSWIKLGHWTGQVSWLYLNDWAIYALQIFIRKEEREQQSCKLTVSYHRILPHLVDVQKINKFFNVCFSNLKKRSLLILILKGGSSPLYQEKQQPALSPVQSHLSCLRTFFIGFMEGNLSKNYFGALFRCLWL